MKKILGLAMLLGVVLISCKKKGCTDILADNFNSAATKDDGSCTHSGHAVFWFDDTTSASLYSGSLMSIDVYIDNVNSGRLNWNQYTSVAPNCGISGYTETIEMTTTPTKSAIYTIRSIPDSITGLTTLLDSGSVVFTRGECVSVEINYP